MTLSKDLRDCRMSPRGGSEGVFWAEGTIDVKALRWQSIDKFKEQEENQCG